LRENDFIKAESFDLIKDEMLELCKILLSEFISIIDIIAPPDFILGAPLGFASDNVIIK